MTDNEKRVENKDFFNLCCILAYVIRIFAENLEIYTNLNMIDVIGSGIKKMFTIQRERFFPMPTYNISDEEHTEVTIHGELINENYSRQLKKHHTFIEK